MKINQTDLEKEHGWLASYAKKKPINNYGGNYWGINRNRCTIMKPEMIKALADAGLIVMNGNSFTVVPKEKK